jgi:hypothetical protein
VLDRSGFLNGQGERGIKRNKRLIKP